MDETTIYKDVSRRLLDLMRDTFGDRYHYYLGAPSFMPPDDMMPCLIVHKASGNISAGATMTDDMQETIIIDIMTSQKDDMGNPDNEFQDTTLRKLQNSIEARDPNTGEWLPGTLMQALRTHFTLDEAILGSTVAVNYDVTPRQDAPTIIEAMLTLQVTSIVEVPVRS